MQLYGVLIVIQLLFKLLLIAFKNVVRYSYIDQRVILSQFMMRSIEKHALRCN